MQETIKVKIIINEQHTILEDQLRAIEVKFPGCNIQLQPIPAEGLTRFQMEEYAELNDLFAGEEDVVIPLDEMEMWVFASPIPYLIKLFVNRGIPTYVLHNDKRDKKELPNGEIRSTIASTGWEVL